MKKFLSLLAVAVFALALTACTPKEKHIASGAAIGVAAGAVGAAVLNQDPLTGAALGGVAGTAGGYEWPCKSIRWITSKFGGRQSPGGIGSTNHKGVDIGTPMNTPIYAAKSGTVTWASWNGGYGHCVIIYHGQGNSTLYGHLNSYKCKVGDTVSQGDLVAYSGTSGNSTGPHLHFGIKENDIWVDPLNYLTGWHYYG